MTPQAVPKDQLDYEKLKQQLDMTKTVVFKNSTSAGFYAPLLCSLKFIWTRELSTAGTDGVAIYWNPDFFEKSSKRLREATLVHEIQHVGRLHMLRTGNRNRKVWFIACDYRVNNDMMRDKGVREGYSFEGFDPFVNPEIDRNGIKSEEEIYDMLMSGQIPMPPQVGFGNSGEGDLITPAKKEQVIANVARAVEQAKFTGKGGQIPSNLEKYINKFLSPVIPWQQVLWKFFSDLITEDYTWSKPNRRYTDMYLPSRVMDDGGLTHLAYYLDVSGSITHKDLVRFNSEVKFIQEELKPEKLTLIQFHTSICDVQEFKVEDPFDGIKIMGSGGTSWEPVQADIEERKPTCAVIFTDMGFWDTPKQPAFDIPVLWVCIGNPDALPPFGEMTHIK